MAGRLRADSIGERGYPLADRRRLVVDDVVDARDVLFDRKHGGDGRVLEMDERENSIAAADDRELPLANRPDPAVVAGAVEAAVAERDPAGVRDDAIEVAHGGIACPRARHRRGVELVLLGLDPTALARVSHTGEALGDEAPNASLACGGEQRVRPLSPEAVGRRERLVEVPREPSILQRCRLVDDRLGLRFEHGLTHGARIEQIKCDRLCPERPYALGA